LPHYAAKQAAEVSLVAQSALEGNARKRICGGEHQAPRDAHALLRDVSCRRLLKADFKGPLKMIGAQLDQGGQVVGLHALTNVLAYVGDEALGLPGGKPAARRPCTGGIPGCQWLGAVDRQRIRAARSPSQGQFGPVEHDFNLAW
jgi:hypothetical protein